MRARFIAHWCSFVTKPRICFFFFNDTATTEIYTLSLHDALPIYSASGTFHVNGVPVGAYTLRADAPDSHGHSDRKSTRLNSSHANISYAVFCLKKQKHQRRAVSSKDAPCCNKGATGCGTCYYSRC